MFGWRTVRDSGVYLYQEHRSGRRRAVKLSGSGHQPLDRAWLGVDPPDMARDPFPESWWSWLDAIRGPYTMAIVVVMMMVVLAADGLWLVGIAAPDTAALLTGVAAVVSALAAVIEAKRGSANASTLAEHEARLRVLEDRSARS